ncbi:uncharacterized protein LOC143448397 isoform X2 [Clavelina lepadiformis]|uniref:uncharacterized protein LOC143448397 isoform X2 n=1 Tax=Clavelina lepadiformis TaxID=159417 RepID=UPI0040433D49
MDVELQKWNFQESVKSTTWQNYEVFPQKRSTHRHTPHKSLHKAVREGDLEYVEAMLKEIHKEVDTLPLPNLQYKYLFQKLNAKDQKGWTALHYATMKNYTEICEALYKYSKLSVRTAFSLMMDEALDDSQLDLCAQTNDGATAFHFAAQGNKLLQNKNILEGAGDGLEKMLNKALNEQDCLSKLIEWHTGKKIELMKDSNKMTPLHWACKKNNPIAAVKLLGYDNRKRNKPACAKEILKAIMKKTNAIPSLLNCLDVNNMSPLHHCAIHHANETAEILIKLGADLRLQNRHGETPLHCAVAEGNIPLCNYIIEYTEKTQGGCALENIIEITDNQGNTALHTAAQKSCSVVVGALLQHGNATLIKQYNKYGDTALHLAATSGSLRIIKKLIESQMSVHFTNNIRRTAVHAAAKYDHHEIVKYLVERGASLEEIDSDQRTPLLLAAYYGNLNTLTYLLKTNCNLLVTDIEDKTCLHLAVIANREKVLQHILANDGEGELINKADHDGNTPLHLSAMHGCPKTIQVVLQHPKCNTKIKNEKGRCAIHLAATNGHDEILNILLKKNPSSIHTKDEDGNTPLIAACIAGDVSAVKCLIKHRANLEERNCDKHNALCTCAVNDFSRTAKVLIQAGAKFDFSESDSTSPLHLACINGSSNMVQLLLKFGAFVSLPDNDGNRPLELAIKHGHKNCAKLILESPKWKAALRSAKCKTTETGEISTPLRHLIKTMPDIAEVVFNRCTTISPNLGPEDEDYNVEFDFEFLDDVYTSTCWEYYMEGEAALMAANPPCFEGNQLVTDMTKPYCDDNKILRDAHPLAIMAENKNTPLLSHPLVNVLLHYKWKRYGRTIYYTLLSIYAVFLLSITFYLLSLPPPYAVMINGTGVDACFIVKQNNDQIWKDSNCECCQYGSYKNTFQTIFMILTVLLAGISLIKEVFQLLQSKLAYFREFDNYIEVTAYGLAIVVVINWDETSQVTGVKQVWQWQLGAVCLLTCWINLALFLRKLPSLGIYVIMVVDILKTFSKFFVSFLVYILGFSIFFYMLLQNQDIFQTWWQSLIKVTVMMIGELDYGDIFFTDDPFCNTTATNCYSNALVYYPEITYIVFVLFLIVLPIIIMNLLVGLAVDDIKLVQQHAARQKMAMQKCFAVI